MSLKFGTPPDNTTRHTLEPVNRPPLQADGNLDYLGFIALLKHLWSKSHPDICIKPVQSKTYTKYPVIIYSLDLRKTFVDEPKPKLRNEHYLDDGTTKGHIITGQRFTNIIRFTVITKNEPELCEQIIELFEDWMDEHVWIFKKSGVSDMFYSRRMPDGDENRTGEDIDKRAVTYMVVLEKLKRISVDKLEEIAVSARLFLESHITGTKFEVLGLDQYITIEDHILKTGDYITVVAPRGEAGGPQYPLMDLLPPNLYHGWTYKIKDVDGTALLLSDLSGKTIDPGGPGQGGVILSEIEFGNSHIEDQYQTATPSD